MCRIRACTALLLLLTAGGVRADDLDLGAEPAAGNLAWSGDFLARQDWLRSWTYGDRETRLLLRLRYGPTWQINDQWTLAGAVRVNESTVGNEYLVDYNDNQRPRDLALDTLYLQYTPAEGDELLVGQSAFPLTLSRMLWDPDLRPAGVSYAYTARPGGDSTLRLVGGAFVSRYLYGIESRIYALQGDWRFREDETLQPEFILSYLHFTGLDPLIEYGEDRGNPVTLGPPCSGWGCVTCGLLCLVPDGFADQYELADLQFALHKSGDLPFRLLLDADKNLGAAAGNDRAGRIELALGDSFRAGGQEAGYAAERMQRSSVVGAFNDDDWWFHAASHGVMLWYAYGWSDTVRLRAAWFHEQPDGSRWHWNRVLLDLTWRL
ncbi:MAG: hypothetical protein ACM3ZT_02835 [Bacillota bacterium]